jgi:xylulokinase
LWAQLLASAIGVALYVHEGAEGGGAPGAARLAWLADGGDEADVCRPSPVAREYRPNPAEAALLAPRYARFRALYPALREQFATPLPSAPAPAVATLTSPAADG